MGRLRRAVYLAPVVLLGLTVAFAVLEALNGPDNCPDGIDGMSCWFQQNWAAGPLWICEVLLMFSLIPAALLAVIDGFRRSAKSKTRPF